MNKLFFFLAFFCAVQSCLSQVIGYYDADNAPTDSTNCYYFRTGLFGDTVKTFFYKTKKIRSKESYKLGIKEGPSYYYHGNGKLKEKLSYHDNHIIGAATEYYSNGKAKVTRLYLHPDQNKTNTSIDYLVLNSWDSLGKSQVKNTNGYFKDENEEGEIVKGLRDSVWITYDESGKMKISETYKMGEFAEGSRYLDNEIIHFTHRELAASPKGGMESMYKFVGRTLRYPVDSRREGIQGKVFISFVVEKNGDITNATIVKGFNQECDQEALRVVKLFQPWIPGIKQGLPARQAYTIPLVFKLSK